MSLVHYWCHIHLRRRSNDWNSSSLSNRKWRTSCKKPRIRRWKHSDQRSRPHRYAACIPNHRLHVTLMACSCKSKCLRTVFFHFLYYSYPNNKFDFLDLDFLQFAHVFFLSKQKLVQSSNCGPLSAKEFSTTQYNSAQIKVIDNGEIEISKISSTKFKISR